MAVVSIQSKQDFVGGHRSTVTEDDRGSRADARATRSKPTLPSSRDHVSSSRSHRGLRASSSNHILCVVDTTLGFDTIRIPKDSMPRV